MLGMILSIISIDDTPGYPAPLMAWRVAIWTASMPQTSTNGLSASAMPMTEQLGFVTSAPRQPRVRRWSSMRLRCSGLTSGISNGTSAVMRYADAFEQTAVCAAQSGSYSRAASVGSADKAIATSATTSLGCTIKWATSGGGLPSSTQRTSSPYGRPIVRSEPVKTAISNHG